jgi:glycolate oxidase iron-sulfur subunit
MAQVSNGAPVTPSYREHIDLCLGCRGCESACPSGVQYGRLLEDARAHLETEARRGWLAERLRRVFFFRLLESRAALAAAGTVVWLYDASGLRRLMRALGRMKLLGRLGDFAVLAPSADPPFFFSQVGRSFAPEGAPRYRVAFLSGCIANVTHARLNEATVRVLQKNGCEVVIPAGQGCCGAMHLHAGLRDEARKLARRNIDAIGGDYDAIISNAAGCGAALKEYAGLLADDPEYAEPAREFSALVWDVTEFLASVGLISRMGMVEGVATYQDSCHLARTI